ncbi:MAG: ATP-binding protein [Syntrophobacteraceae bacterium]|nr:ATP-binding protein [Syntrophobacteraceae bacterium]
MGGAGFSGPVILEAPSDPAVLSAVRALTDKICLAAGVDPAESDKLVLAVDEACTNVIRHGYCDRLDGRIKISFTVEGDRLEIEIRDFGRGADPATFRGRDLGEVRPGGLGMHFIRSAVDTMEYDWKPGGGMVLKMVKFISKQEKA